MNKIYKVIYSVNSLTGAECNIYTYPVLYEKPTYFVLQLDGYKKKHLKKNLIDTINYAEVEGNAFETYITDSNAFETYITDIRNIDSIITQMANLVKGKALLKIQKYQQIYNNATSCAYKMIEMN